MNEIAEQVGQAAVEVAVDREIVNSPMKDAAQAQQQTTNTTDQQATDSNKEKTVGGYTAKDLVEAPIKVPEPVKKDSKWATSNPIVKTLVLIGVILVTLGLIFAFTLNMALGIILMVLGSIAIIACVFLPVGIRSHK